MVKLEKQFRWDLSQYLILGPSLLITEFNSAVRLCHVRKSAEWLKQAIEHNFSKVLNKDAGRAKCSLQESSRMSTKLGKSQKADLGPKW